MKEIQFGGQSSPISLKSTLISLVPFAISEFKPGLCPGQFDIPASENGEPVCKVIGESIYWVYIDSDRGSLRVTDPSYKLAQSIVADYNQCQLAAKPECHPAFFWKLGEFTPEQIKAQFPEELEMWRNIQMNWFIELIKLADDDWEKTRAHYSISDIQRFALKAIDPTNSKMRPWVIINPLTDKTPLSTMLCGSCGSDVPISAVVCRYCQYVLDPERHASMTYAQGLIHSTGIDLKKLTRQ